MAKKQTKYYVVWKGRKPGIYNSWRKCQKATNGFPGAIFKSYPTKQKAEQMYKLGNIKLQKMKDSVVCSSCGSGDKKLYKIKLRSGKYCYDCKSKVTIKARKPEQYTKSTRFQANRKSKAAKFLSNQGRQ